MGRRCRIRIKKCSWRLVFTHGSGWGAEDDDDALAWLSLYPRNIMPVRSNSRYSIVGIQQFHVLNSNIISRHEDGKRIGYRGGLGVDVGVIK